MLCPHKKKVIHKFIYTKPHGHKQLITDPKKTASRLNIINTAAGNQVGKVTVSSEHVPEY